jgi:hypothetical protein
VPAVLVEVAGLDGAALVAGDQLGRLRHLDQLDVIGVRAVAASALEVGAERGAAHRRQHRA